MLSVLAGALALAGCKESPRAQAIPSSSSPRPTPALDGSTGATTMLTLPSDLLTRAARVQLSFPDGVASELRPFLDHRIADLWAVNLDGGKRQAIAVFYAPGGAITPPLGLAEAGRRLIEMGVFRDPDWKGALFYPVLAAGAMTPGLPDYPTYKDHVSATGELVLVLDLEEPALRYAARGGLGPPPASGFSGGTAKEPRHGQAVFTLAPNGAVRWTYTIDGKELASFGASAATAATPIDVALALDLLEGARTRVGAPRAMLAAAPQPLGAGVLADLYRVELIAIGPVHVDRTRPARSSDLAAARARLDALGAATASLSPAELVAVLDAIGGLPPGLVAADLSAVTALPGGALQADLAGPLAHWSAGGMQGPSPRWLHFTPPPSWQAPARAHLDRAALRWSLEVHDGNRYVPLPTSW